MLLMLLGTRVVSVSSHTFSGSFSQVSNSLLTKKVLYIVPDCIRNAYGPRFTFTLWEDTTYNKGFFLVCGLNSRSDWCWATCEQVLQVHTSESLTHKHVSLPVGTAALGRAVCQLARPHAFEAEDVLFFWSGLWTVSLGSLRGSSWHWTRQPSLLTLTHVSSGLHWHLVDTETTHITANPARCSDLDRSEGFVFYSSTFKKHECFSLENFDFTTFQSTVDIFTALHYIIKSGLFFLPLIPNNIKKCSTPLYSSM